MLLLQASLRATRGAERCHRILVRRLSESTKLPPPSRSLSFPKGPSEHLLERIALLDQRLNYSGWHTLRWTSFFVVLGGSLVWLFREDVYGATSEVTRRTLEDSGVQQQASEIARGVAYELLNDQRALELSTQFLQTVILREEIKRASQMLVSDVLVQKETLDSLQRLVQEVLKHPDTSQHLARLFAEFVAQEETRQSLVLLLESVLAQESTQQITSDFFKRVMARSEFVSASHNLGYDTVHYLLNDPSLKKTAIDWMNAVLNDRSLQNTAGDAVWAAVKGAFVPWGKKQQAKMEWPAAPGGSVEETAVHPPDAAEDLPVLVVVKEDNTTVDDSSSPVVPVNTTEEGLDSF